MLQNIFWTNGLQKPPAAFRMGIYWCKIQVMFVQDLYKSKNNTHSIFWCDCNPREITSISWCLWPSHAAGVFSGTSQRKTNHQLRSRDKNNSGSTSYSHLSPWKLISQLLWDVCEVSQLQPNCSLKSTWYELHFFLIYCCISFFHQFLECKSKFPFYLLNAHWFDISKIPQFFFVCLFFNISLYVSHIGNLWFILSLSVNIFWMLDMSGELVTSNITHLQKSFRIQIQWLNSSE